MAKAKLSKENRIQSDNDELNTKIVDLLECITKLQLFEDALQRTRFLT